MTTNNRLTAKLIRTTVAVAAAAAMTAVGVMPASAEEEAAVSTSSTAGATSSAVGVVTVQATAKAFRAARQNGSANLTVVYDCNATAAPALRTQVTQCRIITDTGAVYDDPSEIFQGENATSPGTVTLPGSSAKICAAGAGRMAIDGALQTATADCTLINLAL